MSCPLSKALLRKEGEKLGAAPPLMQKHKVEEKIPHLDPRHEVMGLSR
jgi:hypothetical protein